MDEKVIQLFDSLKTAVVNGLYGRMAHVSPDAAFEALDWKSVNEKPGGATHSIWEILHHLIYWQNYCLYLLDGGSPTSPEHAAESWICPEKPVNEKHWLDTIARFMSGLSSAEEASLIDLEGTILAKPQESRIEVLESLIGHNSYHLGQIVMLRQLLGAWPPPSGGNTW
ncbi:DinB family protein [Alicyclobacillaceae bacterium I2511]|jgi:uncharacterized damage-inducible protein DinB|nr:DinB family protein [Alicyclobacillaceae bacterium I2511]